MSRKIRKRRKILRPDPVQVWKCAKQLEITDQDEGTSFQWEPYWEQFEIWQMLAVHTFVFFLKVRQIGASTAVLLDDLLWCILNDSAGNRVKCGLFIDTDKKAREQFMRAKHMLDQMGASYDTFETDIIFPGGTVMHFVSAGSKRAGASMTFQRLHLTELPFWRDATNSFSAIMQVLGRKGQCIIETTMGLDDPVAKTIWTKTNQYHKVFFSFEDHKEYRAPSDDDPDYPMSDEEEEWLRGEGWSNTLSMRYWLWLLRNKSANDVHKNFREYPQLPKHSFMYAEGRWCNVDPKTEPPLRTVSWPDENMPGELEIFREPEDCSHYLLIGVDTAGGRGLDRSVAVVIDGMDNKIVASFVSADIRIFPHAQVVKEVQKIYTRSHQDGDTKRVFRPLALVERNAIGHGIVEELQRLRVKLHEFTTTEASKQRFMELTVRNILDENCYGPEDLLVEAQDARLKNGRFIGMKDLFMSCGFCYDWLENVKYKELRRPTRRNVLTRRGLNRRR